MAQNRRSVFDGHTVRCIKAVKNDAGAWVFTNTSGRTFVVIEINNTEDVLNPGLSTDPLALKPGTKVYRVYEDTGDKRLIGVVPVSKVGDQLAELSNGDGDEDPATQADVSCNHNSAACG